MALRPKSAVRCGGAQFLLRSAGEMVLDPAVSDPGELVTRAYGAAATLSDVASTRGTIEALVAGLPADTDEGPSRSSRSLLS
ncbi:hypothetical protein [Streptomyces sp. Ag109_O5-1]|uniref:hypothetical protein n=1 Tax=Streptomyces sp. Ag109_O5-1 TaxID=1938851 RepID=UPI001C852745|nr:hypothetical protein [Streptomyces sp. Ag109_O5-1]